MSHDSQSGAGLKMFRQENGNPKKRNMQIKRSIPNESTDRLIGLHCAPRLCLFLVKSRGHLMYHLVGTKLHSEPLMCPLIQSYIMNLKNSVLCGPPEFYTHSLCKKNHGTFWMNLEILGEEILIPFGIHHQGGLLISGGGGGRATTINKFSPLNLWENMPYGHPLSGNVPKTVMISENCRCLILNLRTCTIVIYTLFQKECVAVLIELYKNNVSVLCVGSHFLSDWALYTVNPQPLLIWFARNMKKYKFVTEITWHWQCPGLADKL